MRLFAGAAMVVSLLACGSSTVSGAEMTPEVTDNVVAPTGQYILLEYCTDPKGGSLYIGEPTYDQTKCCNKAGCAVNHSPTSSAGCTTWFCDCGIGTPNGQRKSDIDDTTYYYSDCRK